MSIWTIIAVTVLTATNPALGQCNYEMIKNNGPWACSPIDIDVYKPIPPQANSWDYWLNKAASFAGGLHPGVHIVSFGVSQLTDGMTGAFQQDPNTENIKFQSQVNEAFKRTQECIDDTIVKSVKKTATTTLQTIVENFNQLHIAYKTASDTVFATQFQFVFNEMHNFINNHFDTSKAKWDVTSTIYKDYIAYLPLFKEAALAFDQINTAYLVYLKEVKKSDGDFVAKYQIISDDAADLSTWIKSANNHSFNIEGFGSDITSIDGNMYFIKGWHPLTLKEFGLTLNPAHINPVHPVWGQAFGVTDKRHHWDSSSRNDDTANFNMFTKIITPGGNSLICKDQVLNCPIKWIIDCEARGRFSVHCRNTDVTPQDECRTKVIEKMRDNLREYLFSVTTSVQVVSKFDTEYSPYIKTINDKLLEIKQKYPESKL